MDNDITGLLAYALFESGIQPGTVVNDFILESPVLGLAVSL